MDTVITIGVVVRMKSGKFLVQSKWELTPKLRHERVTTWDLPAWDLPAWAVNKYEIKFALYQKCKECLNIDVKKASLITADIREIDGVIHKKLIYMVREYTGSIAISSGPGMCVEGKYMTMEEISELEPKSWFIETLLSDMMQVYLRCSYDALKDLFSNSMKKLEDYRAYREYRLKISKEGVERLESIISRLKLEYRSDVDNVMLELAEEELNSREEEYVITRNNIEPVLQFLSKLMLDVESVNLLPIKTTNAEEYEKFLRLEFEKRGIESNSSYLPDESLIEGIILSQVSIFKVLLKSAD